MKPIKQINLKKNMKVNDLLKEMNNTVFGGGRLAKASLIINKMIKDKQCKVFLGAAGALVPSGMKNILIEMLENNYIDVFVTTGANLTHDLIEALGYKHYQGHHNVDDKKLFEKGIDRIYESFMPNKVYEALEDFFNKHFETLKKKQSIKEFLWELGRLINKKSILNTCYKKKIPIFCPGIADSGIGLMIWGNLAKGKTCNVKVFDDLKEILDIAWTCKKSGIIYLGGGVPKNYIQQAMQFSKGASYGVQITMDRPEPGGSSGAELKEGISWGKLNKKAEYVNVICDTTIALPIIFSAIK